MGFVEIVYLAIRWLHSISAAAWVGGSILYFFILRPLVRRYGGDIANDMAHDFRSLVHIGAGVLIVTGVIMTFDRLNSGFASSIYVILLAIKIGLAFYMFHLARFMKGRTQDGDTKQYSGRFRLLRGILSNGTMIVVVGLAIFLIADILNSLYHMALNA